MQAAYRARGPQKRAAHCTALGAVIAAGVRVPCVRRVSPWGPPVEAEAAPVGPTAREPARGTRGTWPRLLLPRPQLAEVCSGRPSRLAQQVIDLIQAPAVGKAPRALDLLRAGGGGGGGGGGGFVSVSLLALWATYNVIAILALHVALSVA